MIAVILLRGIFKCSGNLVALTDIVIDKIGDAQGPTFVSRLVLAATLSPSYGVYSGYEWFEAELRQTVQDAALTDRVVGMDGLLIVGVSAITLRAMQTGQGTFLPVAVLVTLVGFVSTAVVARYIEGRGR